ncbi:MAG: type VII secretion protein EccE [Actinomycetota bacterium]|nr:type VII secretion protein EccE [Actinomycetota bacterium]
MPTTAPATGPSMVRFGRHSTRGVILGFSLARAVTVAISTVLMILGLVSAGGTGFLVSGLLWAPLLASAFVTVRGRPAIEWAPVAGQYAGRKATGQSEFRAKPSKPRPAGTLALPGDAASLRFYDDPVTGACMIHDPHRQTISGVLAVEHPAYVLLAPEEQAQRVSAWGRTLASLAQSGTCAVVQVLEATVPDPGTGVAGWYEAHGIHDGGWADGEYRALLEQSTSGSSTHRTTITIALDMKRAAKAVKEAGRGMKGAAALLAADMVALEHGLRTSGLRVGHWLSATELAAIVRSAYDPASNVLPGQPGAKMETAGPVAISEHWDRFRSDSDWSTVLWVSDWPRIDVPPHFLHPLVFAPGIRKTISIVARPLGTTEALKAIRREKTEAISDSHQKAKIGQIQDLSDAQEYDDLLDRERALISGHADVAFSGFISVTAATEDMLCAAVSQIERAASQAACETRILYGRQTQGFVVAALPLARGVL